MTCNFDANVFSKNRISFFYNEDASRKPFFYNEDATSRKPFSKKTCTSNMTCTLNMTCYFSKKKNTSFFLVEKAKLKVLLRNCKK